MSSWLYFSRRPSSELHALRVRFLAAALQCDQALSPGPTSAEEEFRAIRDMVVAVFTRSRKMAALPAARRRELGAAIHAQTTAESIKMLALSALETSQAFDGAARDQVANDIFDSRYDRLLLPDRFDCEEVQRRAARESGVVYVDVGAGGVGAGGAGAAPSSYPAVSHVHMCGGRVRAATRIRADGAERLSRSCG